MVKYMYSLLLRFLAHALMCQWSQMQKLAVLVQNNCNCYRRNLMKGLEMHIQNYAPMCPLRIRVTFFLLISLQKNTNFDNTSNTEVLISVPVEIPTRDTVAIASKFVMRHSCSCFN